MTSTPRRTTAPDPANESAALEGREEPAGALGREARGGVQRCRELAELLPVAITEADRAGRFVFVNRYGLEALGFTSLAELHGKTMTDVIAPGDRERARTNWGRRLAGEALAAAEYQLIRRDGTVFPAEVRSAVIERDGAVVGMRSVAVDISDRVRLERQRRRLQTRMLEAQKLESLGVLAGGIAHDFNNLLTVLIGNAELALLELPDGSAGRSYVADIQQAAQRAAELTRQMLAYAGKAPITQREVAINRLIRKMNALLELSTEHRARIELHLAPGLPRLRADPHQLGQVLLNLVTNAVEAIEGVSGTVQIETKEAIFDADGAGAVDVVDGTLAAGRYVTLAVADDGRGMDEDTRRRIFEPFFSTKFTGRGLGLAAVLGIVRAHHGAV
ncbi:MAG: hybrid sensor histidine kinase/response regulator, partial [Proteobacteria bacterium]